MPIDAMGFGAVATAIEGLAAPFLKFIPDPQQKAAAVQEAAAATSALRAQVETHAHELALADFELLKAQASIDLVEAGSHDRFVSGWRPFLGWSLSSVFVLVPLVMVGAALCRRPIESGMLFQVYLTATSVLVGLLGLRTYDKLRGIDSGAPPLVRADPPPSSQPSAAASGGFKPATPALAAERRKEEATPSPAVVVIQPPSVPTVVVPRPLPPVPVPPAAAVAGEVRFLRFMDFVLERETSYDQHGQVITEHDPDDAGGATRYGVDQRSHPNVNVDKLTRAEAIEIYRTGDWAQTRAAELPVPLGEVLFDVHIVGGHGTRWLQESLNASGASLTVDGFMGPLTIAAAHVSPVGEVVKAFLVKRDAYYESLAVSRPQDKKFLFGWLERDARLREWIIKQAAVS